MRALAGIALLLAGLAPALAAELAARSDRYSVQWGDIELGEGTISLKPLGGGCYLYESLTHPVALVRWTYGSPRDASRFCLRDGAVVAQHYEYVNEKRRKDSFSLEFDWKAGRVKDIRGGEVHVRQLPPGPAYDRFVIREAVRLWVQGHPQPESRPEASFTMVDEDRIRSYRFAIRGRETVEVPAGRFDTLRVERVDHPKKSYRYWVAPSRGYLPVKIEHINKGKAELRMELLGER